jgi:hypothetical protein
MAAESETGTKISEGTPSESIDPGRSVIVVSDLHLGGTEDPHTSARFSRFLEFVSGLYPGDRQGAAHDQTPDTLNLLPPQKFILLGDFFDLWDPRCTDRNNVLLDAMIPVTKLGEMDCDVIFVTGNHDEDIGELVDLQKTIENVAGSDRCRKEPDPCEKRADASMEETARRPERSIRYLPPVNEGKPDEGSKGLEFRTRSGRKFSVYKKSYIPGPAREGLRVGDAHYAFLHGHQFDPEQITARFSEIIKIRFDPVDIIMDYANTGLAKSISKWQSLLFLILWIIALAIMWNWSEAESLAPIFGGVVFGTFALLVLYQGSKAGNTSELLSCSLAIFAIIVILLVAGLFNNEILGKMFWIAFIILVFIALAISIPKIVAHVKRGFYNLIKAPTMSIESVVGKDSKEQYKYFRPDKFTLTANVVIFAHTHCAGRMLFTIPADGEKPHSFFLINSGGWVRVKSVEERADILKRFKNILTRFKIIFVDGWFYRPLSRMPCPKELLDNDSFVYIDADAVQLMKWVEDEREGKPCSGRVETISRIGKESLIARTEQS